MKTKKHKARRMFANPSDLGELHLHLIAHRDPSADRGNTLPVVVIPLYNVETIRKDVRQAINWWFDGENDYKTCLDQSTEEVLRAIGVLPKARKGRK